MKTKIITIIIGIIIFSSCSINDTMLENTCWEFYKAEDYDPGEIKTIKELAKSDEDGHFTFYFEKRSVTLNNSETSVYKLKGNKLNLSGVRHDIIEFNDTLMITIDYYNNNSQYPKSYNFYKKKDCDNLKKGN